MTARTLKTVLARSVLARLAAISLIACGSREPATDAERLARGRELVEQMSAKLAAATALSATTTETRDIVRFSGKKDTVSQTAVYTVRRPDRFYVKMTGGRGLETWYNGKILTIAAHPDKVFAQAPMPETIDRTLDAIAERYDMALPMGDLFYSSAAKALLSDTTTGGYVGKENVGNTSCRPPRLQGRRRRLGALASGAGRSSAAAIEGRAEKPNRPAGHRSDVHVLGSRRQGHRRDVRSQSAGGLRGHRDRCSAPRRSRPQRLRQQRSPPHRPRSSSSFLVRLIERESDHERTEHR